MSPSLLRRSPVPLYAQVKELLRSRIGSASRDSERRLPSERELARQLGVSRMTVRQALRDLADEGTVFTAPGRGTFLATNKMAQPLGALTSFTQDMLRRGLAPSSTTLAAEQIVDPHVAEVLGIAPESPIARIRRLRLADGEPMAIETTHLPLVLCPGILALDLEHGSLYETLSGRYQLRLRTAEQSIEARIADHAIAQVLRLEPHSAVLFIERRTQLEDGRTIEFVRSYYRGDRYQFRVRLAV